MDHRAVLAAFDEQMRRRARPSSSGGRFELAGNVLRVVGPAPGDWTGIEWSDLDESTADGVIAAQLEYFAGLGREFEWKYYSHDEPADLAERLARAGLRPDEPEALMIADIADVPMDNEPPPGVEVVEVTDAAGAEALVSVHEEVFGGDYSALGRRVIEQLGDGLVTGVLAMVGGKAVSGARIDFHPGTEFASLWGGGTLPEWRGKGIYSALVSHRARLASARGFRYLRVDALPTSRPILERHGFAQLSTTVPYLFTPR
jgi:GNAT superfamily N-acetyltransferase